MAFQPMLKGKLRLNRPFNQNFIMGWYYNGPELEIPSNL